MEVLLMYNVSVNKTKPAVFAHVLLTSFQTWNDFLQCMQWDQFLKLGDNIDSKVVEDIISSQHPRDCASLIYTVSRWKVAVCAVTTDLYPHFLYTQSGTTGGPKGVMITHDNVSNLRLLDFAVDEINVYGKQCLIQTAKFISFCILISIYHCKSTLHTC